MSEHVSDIFLLETINQKSLKKYNFLKSVSPEAYSEAFDLLEKKCPFT